MGSHDYPNACQIRRVTARGHHFIAETRDPDRWDRIKSAAAEYGPPTLNTIQTAISALSGG